MSLDKLVHNRKLGTEDFRNGSELLGFRLSEFWQWAASDLVSNAMRGRLAEFLVAKAAGVAQGIRNEWDSFDLTLRSGLRVEVKSAAYLQTWGQKSESTISFGIGATLAWDPNTGEFEPEDQRRRQADIYVFALLSHRDKQTLNPLDVSQWEFFLLRTAELDARCVGQKKISLGSLRNLKPRHCGYAELEGNLRELEDACRLTPG